MSNVSTPTELELDFWEFVSCGVCHLEFVKDNGGVSSVPFWLTECGHVVCNSHINPDQSCAECGSQGIQLIPLAREMDQPMSNWFVSAPLAFDAVGFALRFQMNAMANLLRYFKRKYVQYRPLYDRLKDEHAETKRLRKLVDDLQQENQQLRQQLHGVVGRDGLNENNKRRRVDDDGEHRTSSPHSAASASTPIGPDRLTLPPGRHQPHFNARQPTHSHDSSSSQQHLAQYSYAPPRSAQARVMAIPSLSHTQAGPARRRQEDGVMQNSRSMPPPPLPPSRVPDASLPARPPPSSTPLPQRQRPLFMPTTPMTSQVVSSSSGSQRFVPPTTVPVTPRSVAHFKAQAQQQQRFLPSATPRLPPIAAPSSSGCISQAPSRSSAVPVTGTGGQRTPFVPGTAGRLS